MKVKHTQNGNVKLVLSMDEAEKVRSVLMEATGLASREYVSNQVGQFGDQVADAMYEAGIGYQF
ncbi:hypothetical protein [Paraburkholderia susongensis]|uniref:Uncharacterized protein n=1 Tax=Paraburkholderia susongensis TaxID=1515439 RepID=A0A1X7KRS7_9BURK|nr:hypothetical protein [Paraburkholderia susongensis]SMG43524.1 hypothetical protein SAMN06265784_104169 [Paraburkholderia susongensis]